MAASTQVLKGTPDSYHILLQFSLELLWTTLLTEKPIPTRCGCALQTSGSLVCIQTCPNQPVNKQALWSQSGQCQHFGCHLCGAQTLHSHVLFPGEPVSAGHWVHHYHHSPNAGMSPGPPMQSSLCILHFTALLASLDCHLLTTMAYDHYLAICQPLIYSTCISCKIQGALVGICYTIFFINALMHTVACPCLTSVALT
uniref:G-protein coupled receptors family 1 profile domain-containing protein n=1 Tax=Pipistrellus kuhlii TaxID=59472 RepID=A0A7J7SMF5_PIPKU|nr:hypothetical protein mPipKuh1_009797 [Pipistrellus kuhlii]